MKFLIWLVIPAVLFSGCQSSDEGDLENDMIKTLKISIAHLEWNIKQRKDIIQVRDTQVFKDKYVKKAETVDSIAREFKDRIDIMIHDSTLHSDSITELYNHYLDSYSFLKSEYNSLIADGALPKRSYFISKPRLAAFILLEDLMMKTDFALIYIISLTTASKNCF